MTPDEMKRAAELLETVMNSHRDPEDARYNECEAPEEECCWCRDAKKVAAALRTEADARELPTPQHLYRGWCPDETTGADTRDPHCPACQRMALPPGPEVNEKEQRERGEG